MRRSGADRARRPPAASPRHARGGPPRAATRLAPPRRALPAPPPAPARRAAAPAAVRSDASLHPTHTPERPLVIGARAGGEAEPTEPGLVSEQQHELQRVVRPADHRRPAAADVAAEVVHLLGLAQGDEDLAAIGEPTRVPSLGIALVGDLDAPEVLVERRVLVRDRPRRGRLP